MFETIVVGVDGSAGSVLALQWALRLAATTNAEVVAVYCYAWSPMLGEGTNEDLIADSQRRLDGEWTTGNGFDGVTLRTRVETGDPRSHLPTVAYEEGADLLVVGSRGHGPVSEMVLGSVAHWITHHARIPVVVVPATAPSPPG